MNTSEHILLIILAAALAVFLVLAVIALVFAIRLIQSLRRISQTAEKVVQSAESVGEFFKHTAGPIGLFRFVRSVADMVSKQQRHKKE